MTHTTLSNADAHDNRLWDDANHAIRDGTGRSLSKRWTKLMVSTWAGQVVMALAYVVGAFVLAFWAQSGDNPVLAWASVFLLAGICALGMLISAYLQEIADTIQEFHADFMSAVSHLVISHGIPEEAQRVLRDQYQAKAAGFADAASAQYADSIAVVGLVLLRVLLFILPPALGWFLGPAQ
ncbi:hypothetical protein BH23GEM6_BH23GEM6_12400 [soil metagenome]